MFNNSLKNFFNTLPGLCAYKKAIFTGKAYERIYAYSEGCPRVICSVADLALVVGRSVGVRQVDAPQVVQAHADMEKPSSDGYHYYHFVRSALDPAEPRAPLPPPPSSQRPEGDTLRVIPVGGGGPRGPTPSPSSA